MLRRCLPAILVLAVLGSCSGNDTNQGSRDSSTTTLSTSSTSVTEADTEQEFPDVIDVEVSSKEPGVFAFDVTISSPYDSPDRYADAWRVTGADGTVYGIRELLHDHASEQPFTRSLGGVEIPENVDEVVVEARDLVNGWGGETMRVPLAP